MNRRRFTMLSAGVVASFAGAARAAAGRKNFFSLRREGAHWWLSTPDEKRFFSLGLHRSEAFEQTTGEIENWRRHYGRDAQAWISQRSEDRLERGRFNSWSASGADEVPYCHLVPFSGADLWNRRTQQVNYLRSDWEEWCDYVAREHCQERAHDRNLIGYFYSGSPCWAHEQPQSEWRGPLYDPALLNSPSGRRELRTLARRYYQTTRDAIRRYDANHLILGDRYDGALPLPRQVHEEAHSRVDLFSFQDFNDPARGLRTWHQMTGKPVLLADTVDTRTAMSGSGYRKLLHGLLANPGCVGCHLIEPADGKGKENSEGRFLAWRRVNEAVEQWVARKV